MRYTEDELRSLFQQKFSRKAWTGFLQNFMEGARLRSVPEEFHTPSDNEKGFFLGEYNTSDHYRIGLFQFDVKVASIARKRVGLRNLVKSLINPNWGEFDAAFAVFASDSDWRLSFICDIKEEKTAPKRFTYVFGEKDMLYRTPVQRLLDIQGNVSFAALKKAFSVKELSDEFFDEYRDIYADFVQYLTGNRYIKKTQGSGYELKSFPGEPQNKAFYEALGKDDKRARDFVKKMMGRITFLYFLQQKGWMCGDKNYMLHLFESSSDKDYYLKKVLVPLFFGVLNTKPEERKAVFGKHKWNDELRKAWETIPYLNGGLFEPDDEDKVVDACSTHIFRQNDFEELFEFYSHYNFTIDENDPSDAEVGVDPEMLGKIFESLLEDNKDKGAFYTPKEIVTFMCQEALISYLENKTDIQKERIQAFVLNPDETLSEFSENEKYDMLDAIIHVKVCDPAIGSGAFPMGMLNELVSCRMALLGEEGNRAEVKHEIIHNNIYGVDIEKGAVDIARLRFWLSLVVDEDTPSPLPNLDYKIMQGNSLLEQYLDVDLSHLIDERFISDDLFEQEDYELKDRLNELLVSYYDCSDHVKKAAKQVEIAKLIHRQMVGNGSKFPKGTDLNINVSSNNQFFLWHTWFGDVFKNGGFDICIGNPPYIRHEKLDFTYKQLLCSLYPEVGFGIADILVYFFGLGLNILSPNGVLVFITSNKFLKTQYGSNIRKHFADKVDVDFIIDFFELPVFNAATDAAITKLAKKAPSCNTRYFPMLTLDNLDLTQRIKEDYLITLKYESEWQFVRAESIDVLNKISQNSISLKHFVQDSIFRGVTTGFNEAFVLTDEAAECLLNSESSVLVEPYAKSTDIQKWGIKNTKKYFLALLPAKHIDIEKFPTAKQYMLGFGKERLEQVGKEIVIDGETVKTRKKTNNKWFETSDSTAYYPEFKKNKIIYIHTAKDHQFYLDLEGRYINNSCYMIGSDSRYLFAFLNSKLFKFFTRIKFVAYGNGDEGGRCKLDYNKMVTVPVKANVDERPFAEIVDKVLHIKQANPNADVSGYDNQLDNMIYRLYGLSESEITVIESSIADSQ